MSFAVTTPPDAPSTGGHVRAPVLTAALRQEYAIEVTGQQTLGGEVDQNTRIEAADGISYFARVTPGAVDSPDIRRQNELLLHLAETVPALPVPRLYPSITGRFAVELSDDHGQPATLRVMSWLPGRTLAEAPHHSPTLLRELGQTAGRISAGLASMPAPDQSGTHEWDLRRARQIVEASIDAVAETDRRSHVETALAWYDRIDLTDLPQGVVHHDLNDANILVSYDDDGDLRISGVVDVGDALHTVRVAEVAIAVAYAMVRKDDPLRAATEVVAGFYAAAPLTAQELAVVYPLALARLCMNAVTWSQRIVDSGSDYGRSRMRHTWPTLARLVQIHPVVAEAAFRLACDLPKTEAETRLAAVSDAAAGSQFQSAALVDLRPASDLFDERDWTSATDVAAALTETRDVSDAPLYVPHLTASMLRAAQRAVGTAEPATVQLGAAVLAPAGTVVLAPLAGQVERRADPLVLRHEQDGLAFRSCWWGISPSLNPGEHIAAGHPLGPIAAPSGPGTAVGENLLGSGLQVQLVASAGLASMPPPRFIRAADRASWQRISPDPAALLGLSSAPATEPTIEQVLASRRQHIASSQRHYYREPMNLVRGRDVWFYDEDARAYLDSLNNVTHVGHAEPRITAAATHQLRKLNTNSRFVYPQIASYTEKLMATLPAPLEVVFLVGSGSEANDLALRIARQVTGRQHILNIDGAYHGNTGWVTGISPNRYKGPGGQGAPPTTHEVTIPDRYRGPYGYDDPQAGPKYAAQAAAVIERISGDGRRPAAFIAESLMGTAGNIVHPPQYLADSFAAARRAGALCISDEVQVGVGRLGPWWGFQLQQVIPDIVTMGKPLGNGHPLAAVVTTRAIADAFDTGMKYFNTFGGNPVSCAIGEMVLDIVSRDNLRERAVAVGGYFADSLRQLQSRHELIGDVRAEGLYLGVELVRDRTSKEPARDEAFAITEMAKERGVIVFPNGVYDNVLKIKPPMTFARHHVDLYVEALDDILSRLEAIARDRRQ